MYLRYVKHNRTNFVFFDEVVFPRGRYILELNSFTRVADHKPLTHAFLQNCEKLPPVPLRTFSFIFPNREFSKHHTLVVKITLPLKVYLEIGFIEYSAFKFTPIINKSFKFA